MFVMVLDKTFFLNNKSEPLRNNPQNCSYFQFCVLRTANPFKQNNISIIYSETLFNYNLYDNLSVTQAVSNDEI